MTQGVDDTLKPRHSPSRDNMSHYRLSIGLCVALTLLQLAWALYFTSLRPNALGDVLPFALVGPALIVGLWFQSKFIRYVGGVLCLIWGPITLWTALSTLNRTPFLSRATFGGIGLLLLLIGGILLFSKSFANEFANLRASQSRAKSIVRTVLVIIIAIAAAIGIFQDTLALITRSIGWTFASSTQLVCG